MTVTFDNSILLGWYQAKAGILPGSTGDSSTSGAASAPAVQYAPTAPWSNGTISTDEETAAVQQVMGGQNFIDENAAKLDMPGASADYKKLFALYQGLDTLYAVSQQASTPGASAADIARYAKVFSSGIGQITSYTDGLQLDQLRVTVGQTMLNDRSTTGEPVTNYNYTTGTLVTGTTSDVVPTFQGPAAFDMTVKREGVTQTVHMDLSEMGSTPRSMANVVNYMNGKLKAAGYTTQFAISRTAAAPRTVTVGSQTVTLPAVGDALALEIKADSAEQVTFSAAATPAVYATTQAGDPDPDKNVDTADGVLQSNLIKIDPNAATLPASRLDNSTLQGTIGTVHATQVGADGSVYMIADVSNSVTSATTDSTGKTVVTQTPTPTSGQVLQGDTDAVLLKYDSAGQLMYTRTLGAADQATGLNLAVSSTGQVAVVGSVTGGLTGDTEGPVNSSDTSGDSDSFVTLYDASGNETWTMRRGNTGADQATAVAFGADNVVYVAGQAKGSMPNGAAIGGEDSYLTAYSANATGTPRALFTQQFGTTGDDKPTGIAVDGSTVYVAGTESGHAVVRSFDTVDTITSTTKASSAGVLTVTTNTITGGAVTGTTSSTYPAGVGPDATSTTSYTSGVSATPGAVRDLGDLAGGSVAGIVLSGGQLYVAGQTRNGALSINDTTRPYDADMDGFAASISTDLTSQADDHLAYYGGAGNSTVTAMSVANGQVWIGGSAGPDLPGQTMTGKAQGYIAGLDVTTGTVSGAQLLSGKDGIATVTSLAVDPTGASDLDKFGLPKGTMTYPQSQLVVANTSARAGDSFQIRTQAGAPAVTVTIDANDTYDTLAAKIRTAAGFQADVTVASDGTQKTLKIAPINDNYTVEILPGKAGQNALPALGLTEGIARNTTINAAGQSVSTAPGGNVYGLGIDGSISIADPVSLAHAQSVIQAAMTKIKNAYQDLVTAATPASAKPPDTSGPVPAYITAQIANYQAGLNRLLGVS